jgi:hypothetical protein
LDEIKSIIIKKTVPSILVILISLWISPTMAYIDPGSGSAIMSAIIGFFVAISLAIKTYWYKIKSLFSRKETTPTEDNPED